MSDWLEHLHPAMLNGEPAVLITVAETRGSTPRESGTRMLVTAQHCYGTIGGGNLEFQAIAGAREQLADLGKPRTRLRRFPLGPSLGQCCGGVAVLLFEPVADNPDWVGRLLELRRRRETAVMVTQIDAAPEAAKLIVTAHEHHGTLADPSLQHAALAGARAQLADRSQPVRLHADQRLLLEILGPGDFHIVLFGAGHVGKALVEVLSGLPCSIDWIDSRAQQFPPALAARTNIRVVLSDEPEYAADDAPPGSYFLIMTHSHALDQKICERVLQRADFRYCGLIGSATKRARFEHRLRARGLTPQALTTLTCPIGVDGINGKHPLEIAIAVAAELLQVRERADTARSQASATLTATATATA